MPGKANFSVPAGDTFKTTITWTAGGSPVNLTGYEGEFVVYDQAGNVLINATDAPEIRLGSDGTIALHVQTAGVEAGCWSYFLRLSTLTDVTNPTEEGETVTTLLEGSFEIN